MLLSRLVSPFCMNMVLGLMTFHKLKLLIIKLKNSIAVMVHFRCQLDWAKGCSDNWQSSLGVSVRALLEISIWFSRLSQDHHHQCGWASSNPLGASKQNKKEEGRALLSSWAGMSSSWFPSLWTLGLTQVAPWFSGLQTQTELYHWLSWFSDLQMADSWPP